MNYQIEKSMRVIRNLPKEAAAAQRRQKPHNAVPKEWLSNRCLRHIERIKKITAVDTKTKAPILEEAWGIYLDLQEFDPKEGETLHWRPAIRDVSLESFSALGEDGVEIPAADLLVEGGVAETSAPDPIPVEDEKGNDVEISSPHLYAGGLGYRHVNRDAEYLMAVDGSERHHNPYWNPKEATVKPVKHFTKEEIEALNCPSR